MSQPTKITLQQLFNALVDIDTPLHPRFLYRLSDMEKADLDQLQVVWPKVPVWRRQALLEDIERLSESDLLLSFEAFSRFTLRDEDPTVRALAVRTLWDYDEIDLIPVFIQMLQSDPSAEVRAAVASALARFVYIGELEEIPERTLRQVEDALIAVFHSKDELEVRRATLESLGYSSREEVDELIRSAYASDDKLWKASALLAMGRSANPEWQPQVMEMLDSHLPLLRAEAARAAGELEFKEAVPLLLELIDDPDNNTRQASIWSLSQLGGEGVQETLQRLYQETDDEHELELIEEAIDNLMFNEGLPLMPLFDFPKEDEDGDDNDDADDDWYDDDDDDDYESLEDLEDELFSDEEGDEEYEDQGD
jgi:HEAT repeat protein